MKESGRQTTGNIRKTGTRYDDNCTTRVCLEKEVIHFVSGTLCGSNNVRAHRFNHFNIKVNNTLLLVSLGLTLDSVI